MHITIVVPPALLTLCSFIFQRHEMQTRFFFPSAWHVFIQHTFSYHLWIYAHLPIRHSTRISHLPFYLVDYHYLQTLTSLSYYISPSYLILFPLSYLIINVPLHIIDTATLLIKTLNQKFSPKQTNLTIRNMSWLISYKLLFTTTLGPLLTYPLEKSLLGVSGYTKSNITLMIVVTTTRQGWFPMVTHNFKVLAILTSFNLWKRLQ